MKNRRFKNEKFNELANIEPKFKVTTLKADDVQVKSKIVIYGDIGESWWGDSTSAADVEKELENITSDEISVHINSGGGSAFDGIAIYNQLKNHKAKITVVVDGLAASAASIVAMAADDLIMNTGSMMMIHEASTIMWGTKSDFEKEVELLGKLDKSLENIYMTRFKGEREELSTMVTNETWFTAEEAVDIGLADSVGEKTVKEDDDPEEFKNSVLARFRKSEPAASVKQKNILSKFKRDSDE